MPPKATTLEKPAKAAPKVAAIKEEATDDPRLQLAKYLNATKADHFNLDAPIQHFTIPTGSLGLDIELEGGFRSGAQRVAGNPQAGKTPFLLNVIDNFLDTVPKSKAVWFKSEGRLSTKNLSRVRHKVVTKAEDWVDGTIFVFKTNIYETVIGWIRQSITDNPSGTRYAFVLDSLNTMVLRNDVPKPIEEGNRVAGAPMLTAQMFQRIALALNERGHYAFFVSQVTAEIKLNPYDKTPPRQTEGSGGNALAHNANEALEFQNWYEGDLILKDPNERLNRLTNPALGHVVKVKIKKSDTEKRYTTVEIPIRYGVIGGSAIWREREVADCMLMWHLVSKTNPAAALKDGAAKEGEAPKKGGSWLYLSPTLITELADKGITDLPEKLQGMDRLYALLDERKDVTDYLFAKFRSMIPTS